VLRAGDSNEYSLGNLDYKDRAMSSGRDEDSRSDWSATSHGDVANAGKSSVVGGGDGHTHDLTWGADWRPKYLKVIVCRKL
jgi:hypothetical protein